VLEIWLYPKVAARIGVQADPTGASAPIPSILAG